MQAAMMHPYGAVDFVDNSLSSSVGAAAGGVGYPALGASYPGAAVAGLVVGGPPAFLEAHGIRYVPADVPLDATPTEPLASAAVLERDLAPVTDMDINTRVQSSVSAFLANQYARSTPERSTSRLASETQRRINAMKSDIRASEVVQKRGSRTLRDEAGPDPAAKRSLRIELNSDEVSAIKSNPEAMQRIDAAVSREVRRSLASSGAGKSSGRRTDW